MACCVVKEAPPLLFSIEFRQCIYWVSWCGFFFFTFPPPLFIFPRSFLFPILFNTSYAHFLSPLPSSCPFCPSSLSFFSLFPFFPSLLGFFFLVFLHSSLFHFTPPASPIPYSSLFSFLHLLLFTPLIFSLHFFSLVFF